MGTLENAVASVAGFAEELERPIVARYVLAGARERFV